MATALDNAIQFFRDLGLFDIVLPFLLVFSLVFAMLQKTMLLGQIDNKPNKNINSMVSFVIALLVVATNKVVTAINEALPNVVLLVVIIISFLMLVGTFWKTGELDWKSEHRNLYRGFVAGILIAVLFIFAGAIKLDNGQSWLAYAYDYTLANWGGAVVSSFILLLVVVGTVAYVTSSKSQDGGAG